MRFTPLLTVGCMSALLAACNAPTEPAADAPPASPAAPGAAPGEVPPAPPRATWERVTTVNNCNVYALTVDGNDYILVTAQSVYSTYSASESCAIAPAPQTAAE